jgi:creatinine amidohydrolase
MARGVVLALFLLMGIGAARAEPPPGLFLQDLTWTELRAAIQSGKTTILAPIGGTPRVVPAGQSSYRLTGQHAAG